MVHGYSIEVKESDVENILGLSTRGLDIENDMYRGVTELGDRNGVELLEDNLFLPRLKLKVKFVWYVVGKTVIPNAYKNYDIIRLKSRRYAIFYLISAASCMAFNIEFFFIYII